MSHRKILLIAPAWVGDLILSNSLLKLLKQQDPDCEIDVLAPAATFPLLQFMPEVRQGILFETGHGKLGFFKRFRIGRSLKKRGYDQAIVLPNSWKSALIPFFAQIPVRTGWLGENRFGLLNDYRRLNKPIYPQTVQRFLALGLSPEASLEKWSHPSLQIPPQALNQTLQKFPQSPTIKPVLGLCPGAEYGPAKRWPAEYYAEVAKSCLEKGWEVWLIGSLKEREAGQFIEKATDRRCSNWIGKTRLEEAVHLLSLTTVVICNDSGLMHVAAALGKPLIALFGSSSPEHTPPLSEKAQILYLNLPCSPCFKRICPLEHLHCLRQIKPEAVLEAFQKQFNG